MASFVNNGGAAIRALNLAYKGERYRRNNTAAQIDFFYSLNGSTWVAIADGGIPASSFPTTGGATNFSPPQAVLVPEVRVEDLAIADNATFYLRWTINTGSASSQAIAIDDVSVRAEFVGDPEPTSLALGGIEAPAASCVGTPAEDDLIAVTALNRTEAELTLTSNSGSVLLSLDGDAPWTLFVTIPAEAGESTEVFVRVAPVTSGFENVVLTLSGGGAATGVSTSITVNGLDTPPVSEMFAPEAITSYSADLTGFVTTVGCRAAESYGFAYSTTAGFAGATGTQVAAPGGDGIFAVTLEGLAPCTEYYVRPFVVTSGGTFYGAAEEFTTQVLALPMAGDASQITSTSFRANWSAVEGASGYRLDVSTEPEFGTMVAGPTTVETFAGVPTNTGSNYRNFSWNGIDGVLWNAHRTRTDLTINSGNRAVTLSSGFGTNIGVLTSGDIAAGLQSVAFDVKRPLSGGTGTLTVKAQHGAGFATSTTLGTIDFNEATGQFSVDFTPIMTPVRIRIESNGAELATIDNVSFTRAAVYTPSYVAGYENLAVSDSLVIVSGLQSGTTYYYRVRAEAPNCSSANSNTVAVTLPTCEAPAVTILSNSTEDAPLCADDVLELNATLTGTAPFELVWIGAGEFSDEEAANTTVTGAESGDYTIMVENACGSVEGTITIAIAPLLTWYADLDNDGYGDADDTVTACVAPEGYVAESGDLCPEDPAKQEPGDCGCGVADVDADENGISDCLEGCMDPTASNYSATATSPADCSYCESVVAFDSEIQAPINVGSGIPGTHAAVATACDIELGLSALERYEGMIIPATGTNVYRTTAGTSAHPSYTLSKWNYLLSVDLGDLDFTQVQVLLDVDFDPAAVPVWNTVDISDNMIAAGNGNQHIFQASENLAFPYWAEWFEGINFNPNVAGEYDLKVRAISVANPDQVLAEVAIRILVDEEGCSDPAASNYSATANIEGECTYCENTVAYNSTIQEPIAIGSGIPGTNAAVATTCDIELGLSAMRRYEGMITPVDGNRYRVSTGVSSHDANNYARWNYLMSVSLGDLDFSQVQVLFDVDFDPAAAPVWNTVDVSANMATAGTSDLHVFQASQNLAFTYWATLFPGVSFDPNVAGVYDLRLRALSAATGGELAQVSIQVVVTDGPEVCENELAANAGGYGVCLFCGETETFTEAIVTTPNSTAVEGAWFVDRAAPAGFEAVDGKLVHSIASSGATANAFNQTQGRQYLLPAGTQELRVKLTVDPTWATSGRRMAGFWATNYGSAPSASLYPIIEYTSGPAGGAFDTDGARFRVYNNGAWHSMGLPQGFTSGEILLSMSLKDDMMTYGIGELFYTIPAMGSTRIGNVILQGHNTAEGVDYTILWDDLSHFHETNDIDGDGIGDACDDCNILNGTACDDNNYRTINDQMVECECVGTPVPACEGQELVVNILTDNNPGELSWVITDREYGDVVASGGGAEFTRANHLERKLVCLPGGSMSDYRFRLSDSGNNGISNGYWELTDTHEHMFLRGEFNDPISLSTTPYALSASPTYADGTPIALPLGALMIDASQCGKLDYLRSERVSVDPGSDPGGYTHYQFSFNDPDAGWVRNITVPRPWVSFSEMRTSPLIDGKKYVARVRRVAQGGAQVENYGPGCMIGLTANVNCTGLLNNPSMPEHSCGVTLRYPSGNRVTAQQIAGATAYRFRLENSALGYTRVFEEPRYFLVFNFTGRGLVDGHTYTVSVEARVDGEWKGYCGNICSVTINNGGAAAMTGNGNSSNSGLSAALNATLWPNPTSGDQVSLNITGLAAELDRVHVTMFDLQGRVIAQDMMTVNGGIVHSELSTAGLADGTYVVRVHAGTEQIVKRFVVQR